jgi:hypothetical protein
MNRFRIAISCGTCFILLLFAQYAAAASLTIAWDQDTASDVAGFVIAYGTESGVYPNTVQAGNQTSQQISGLADGTTYYFIVQAYNSEGAMSPPSAEVWGQTPGSPDSPSLPPAPTTALTIMCPAPSATSPSGKPVVVTFAPAVSGGTAPISSSCTPASGSRFPVGATALTCSASDASMLTASCSSNVIVTSNSSSSPPPATGVLTDFDGVMATLTGNCPTATFTIGTVSVTTSSVTNYAKGSCSSLADGKRVHVQGLLQPNGTVVATSIAYVK